MAQCSFAEIVADRKQRIIAMVCSNPPEGFARWPVRLVAEEAVKRRLVPRVGRENIRCSSAQPRPQVQIEIHSVPAEFAGSRFREPDDDAPAADMVDGVVLDGNSPIPDTPDGLVYYVGWTSGGEFHRLEDPKKWADAQPWGPVQWN